MPWNWCYESEILCLSAESKAKVNVGGAAVSTYVKMRSFCFKNDMPVLCGDDFPSQIKMDPMGYMELCTKDRHRARSSSPKHRPVAHNTLSVMTGKLE